MFQYLSSLLLGLTSTPTPPSWATLPQATTTLVNLTSPPPTSAEMEFSKLKEFLHKIIKDPQYLSYHLHLTFEINWNAGQERVGIVDLWNTVVARRGNVASLTSAPTPNLMMIDILQFYFGLNNFTTIALPLKDNKAYIQYLTTCKFGAAPKDLGNDPIPLSAPVNESNYEVFSYVKALEHLQSLNIINCIGFKIEGVVFPSKQPKFIPELTSLKEKVEQSSMSSADIATELAQLTAKHSFCYYETHRKCSGVDNLNLTNEELLSYSFKNEAYMSAYRSYNIERIPNEHKYEVCIYETWVKDIEADWKQANIKTQFDISSSSTGSAGGVFNNEEDVAFVRGLKQWKMAQQQQQ